MQCDFLSFPRPSKIGVSKSFGGGWTGTVAATKAWYRTTQNIYGAGYTYDWSRYTVSPANGTFDPIKTAIAFSVTAQVECDLARFVDLNGVCAGSELSPNNLLGAIDTAELSA